MISGGTLIETMTGSPKWLLGTMALLACLFVFGFILFAADVMRAPVLEEAGADGIVVLTGGELRVRAGLKLLQRDRARRLLITGVNPVVRKKDIARAGKISPSKLDCCVDLGYEALNTTGNATEAGDWARRHGFRSLIIVTASYHMPRSLIELSRRLPDVDLVPHPVVPKSFQDGEWWLDAGTARVLLSEYLKLFPAAVRLIASRAFPREDEAATSQADLAPGQH